MFSVGNTYTRRQVQEMLGVPEEKRGGHWQNGYPLYDNQLYIFCNVGAPGRTGHDYPNQWDGDDLVWVARNGATLEQPLMRQISANAFPIHVFARSENERADFEYHGVARTLSSENTVPARFRLGFGSNEAEVLKLGQLLFADSRLFAKSEFGPVHDGWPALSFSSRKIAADFAADFRRDRDFVIYIGTTDPNATPNAEHRSRLLSAVTFEPRTPIDTRQIVSPQSWEETTSKWGVRWEWSFPVLDAYEFKPFPDARAVLGKTYAQLGQISMLGRCVEVDLGERGALLDQLVFRKRLRIQSAAQQASLLNSDDPDVRRALSSLALGIQQRIEQSEKERIGRSPVRAGPNLSDLIISLNAKWKEQGGVCALCGGPLIPNGANRLLQPSPDRIDSANKSYAASNLHLTHLGCNLAKSSCPMEQWDEFLRVLRG